MKTTLQILFCLAGLHFIYQSIILPSIRLSLRFKLFALRDELRSMLMQSDAGREVFRIQQSAINNSIKMLSRADSAMMMRFERELRHDDAMRKRVERRVKLVDEYESEEFQKIVDATREVFGHAIIANMGAWSIYVIPIVILFLCLDRLKFITREALSIPEGELGKVVELDAAFA